MKFHLTMFATQVLPADVSENTAEKDDSLGIVGFIVIDDRRFEVKRGETRIGRDPTVCSVVIENFTVSKVHAVIESEGTDDTFIYDADSTNQTKLGKKTLKPHCRYKLENDSNITFGNITAKFMLPHKTCKNSQSRFNLEELNASDGMEDIFDVATQVSVPHPHITGKILQIENAPDHIQVFKTPELVVSGKRVKEFPGSAHNFTKPLKCQLELQDVATRTENCNGSFDASGIFSLNTQCQIIQCSSKEHNYEDKVCSDDDRNNELDTVKSLLNDGQDSILCTFMSLQSPSGQAQSKLLQVKTEIVEDNLNVIFDKQTQAHAVPTQTSRGRVLEEGFEFKEDLCDLNPPRPNTTSIPFDNSYKLSCRSAVSGKPNTSTESIEEDFIKTQDFNINLTCENALPIEQNASSAPQDLGVECHMEKTADVSTTEGPTENEDFICTQKFVVLDEGLQGSKHQTPENEDLSENNQDFLETQVYDVEKERINDMLGQKIAGKPNVVSESPEINSESYVKTNTGFLHKNMEEDFIRTQVFCETSQDRDADIYISNIGSQEKNNEDDGNDDEDFIATQPVDFLVNSPAKNKSVQEANSRTHISSRESSPDLLGPGLSTKPSIDFTKQRLKTTFLELSEQIDSMFSSNIKKELDKDVKTLLVTDVQRVESSGDETDSDLEIIFEKGNISKNTASVREINSNARSQESESGLTTGSSGEHDNDDSNSSYIFHLEPEAQGEVETKENFIHLQGRVAADSDSDATDCEEIAVVNHEMAIKQELLEKITFEETQVLTLTPPDNFAPLPSPNDGCITDKESPKFEVENDQECWSQLSLKMPSTQDMESTINKIVLGINYTAAQNRDQKLEADHQTPSKIFKTEVGTEIIGKDSTHSIYERQIDSPLKRPGNSSSEVETIPTKKSKMETSNTKSRSSEKQFLRLWQAHDIEQIQPSRTRNSLKNLMPENRSDETDASSGNNNSNKLATSRRETRTNRKNSRKLSFDITSYFCNKAESKITSPRGRKKETPPKENKKISIDGKKVTPFTENREGAKSVECCHRVLRSSRRNSSNIPPAESTESRRRNAPSSRSRRSSRFKGEDYFGNSCVHVVFTGFENESLEQIISNLGGKKTNDLSLGDVVVADKVRRTVKFLSAVGLSLPISSPQWLLTSRAEKKFQNPWHFILKDEESERKWDFELRASLEKSKKAKLMQGLNVFATANAKPPVKDLLAIVKCCGGTPLFDPPDVWPKKTVIVSCPEDKKCWPLAKYRHIKIVHYEFILSGVLKQKLDFKTYKLR